MCDVPAIVVKHAPQCPRLADWNDAAWQGAGIGEITHFQPRGTDHRPRTQFRLLRDDHHLFLQFKVDDCFVRSIRHHYQDMVYRDSCVEFFVQPKVGQGYFTFEINAGGCLLCYYITDPVRVPGGFKDFVKVPWDAGQRIRIQSSLPPVIDPEISNPVTWTLGCCIPVEVLERYVGPLRPVAGQTWRANFFKCGDETSHPHWGMWSPVRQGHSFHQPDSFGLLQF